MGEVIKMPMYEFDCRDCGHNFELIIKFTEVKRAKCVKCGSKQLVPKITAIAGYTIKGGNSASTTPKKFRR